MHLSRFSWCEVSKFCQIFKIIFIGYSVIPGTATAAPISGYIDEIACQYPTLAEDTIVLRLRDGSHRPPRLSIENHRDEKCRKLVTWVGKDVIVETSSHDERSGLIRWIHDIASGETMMIREKGHGRVIRTIFYRRCQTDGTTSGKVIYEDGHQEYFSSPDCK